MKKIIKITKYSYALFAATIFLFLLTNCSNQIASPITDTASKDSTQDSAADPFDEHTLGEPDSDYSDIPLADLSMVDIPVVDIPDSGSDPFESEQIEDTESEPFNDPLIESIDDTIPADTLTSDTEPTDTEYSDPEPELPPDPRLCSFQSTSYGAGMQDFDELRGSTRRLSFTVPGLPSPEVVLSSTLRFDSYDADHPGEEGQIWVNGQGPYVIPADSSWDNQYGTGQITTTGVTIEGNNHIEFGASPTTERSYFSIGNVSIEMEATVTECPDAPPPSPIPRSVHYREATYTRRNNWVVRCDDYAYTAGNREHVPEDCEGLFDPDGSRRGTAIFFFPDVIAGQYEVTIRSRHTTNRNPHGALFVINGVEHRIDQDNNTDYTTDNWGTIFLEGDVNVTLDSSRENESDSVIWVKLNPI